MVSLREHFRPEFLNRLDEIILFDILTTSAIEEIVRIQVDKVKKRLADKDVKFFVSKEVLSYLAKKGYDPQYGARPLKRLIQNEILNKVAGLMISNSMLTGASVYVSKGDNGILVRIEKKKILKKRKIKEKVLTSV